MTTIAADTANNTMLASLIGLVFASIVGPCVTYFLSEARMSKQREWDRQDRHETARMAEKQNLSLQGLVKDSKDETHQVGSQIGQLRRSTDIQHAEAMGVSRDIQHVVTANARSLHSLHCGGVRSRLQKVPGVPEVGGAIPGPMSTEPTEGES